MVETLANNGFDSDDNEWDILDGEIDDYSTEVFADEEEKSAAELEYEKNEQILKSSLFRANDARNEELLARNKEIHDIFAENNHEQTDEIDEIMKKIIGGLHGGKKASLEAMFDYVDSKYPSPFVEREEQSDSFREEDDFKRAMMREGENNEENLNLLAKALTADGSMKDLHISQTLRILAKSTNEDKGAFSDAIIEYLKDTSDKNREKLTRLQSNHEGMLSNSLFNIAATFDESKTAVGEKMLNPTILMATSAIKGSEEIFGGIMKYLRFKINNSKRTS